MPEKTSTMKSGFAVSVLVAVMSWLTGSASTPIINPAWVKVIQELLAKAPLVGPYFAAVPLEALVVVFSLIAAWAMASFLLGRIAGFTGLIVAFVFGCLIWFAFTGQSIFDVLKGFKLPAT